MTRLICWLFGHSIKNYAPKFIDGTHKVEVWSWYTYVCARCGRRVLVD